MPWREHRSVLTGFAGHLLGIASAAGNRSLWLATTERTAFPPLRGDVQADVAVVGGGITGLTVAHLLKEEGKRVALVEMRQIGQGTTGYTTAKLTVGQSLVYAKLRAAHGPEASRLFAESNRDAISRTGELIERLGIHCDWEPASNYVYTESSTGLRKLDRELDAMRNAGVVADITRETELPFPVLAAIRVDDQAQFHPLKYLAGLAARMPGNGSEVFEETLVTGVRSAQTCVVETAAGRILARHVVVATQLPFLDRVFFFAKAHPQKSYLVAAQVEAAAAPVGMYISIDEPTRSIRSAPASGEKRYLIVGGETRRPGKEHQTTRRYRALEEFMYEQFGAEAGWRWSAHDYVPADGMPYIGRIRRRDDRVLVATGFAKWGLTKAMIAARIITDAVLGRPNPWAGLYDTGRVTPRASATALARENAHVAWRFLEDRLRPRRGQEGLQCLASGEGAVLRIGGRHLAAFRDGSGALHVLSARCPHLGCIVGWNEADRTWECPCHGSRFTAEGQLAQGPATEGPRAPQSAGRPGRLAPSRNPRLTSPHRQRGSRQSLSCVIGASKCRATVPPLTACCL
jgi:glycine/D-amino acid oxidase-like deaminating enzyme/nitrite reductase/ring-hydroxylating ferredoxin subunit